MRMLRSNSSRKMKRGSNSNRTTNMAHDIVITNGEITYLRRIKTGDYEHKEASVRLSFTLAENTENVNAGLSRVGAHALAHAEAMLNNRVSEAPVAGVAAATPVASGAADSAVVDGAEAKRGPGRPRKVPPTIDAEVVQESVAQADPADVAAAMNEVAEQLAPDPSKPTGNVIALGHSPASSDPAAVVEEEGTQPAA